MLGLGLLAPPVFFPPFSLYSLHLSGTDDYVYITPNDVLRPNHTTVMGWINIDQVYGGSGWQTQAANVNGSPSPRVETFISCMGASSLSTVGGYSIDIKYAGTYKEPTVIIQAACKVQNSNGSGGEVYTAYWGGQVSSLDTSFEPHNISSLSGWVHLAMTMDSDGLRLFVNGSNDLWNGVGPDTSGNQLVNVGSNRVMAYDVDAMRLAIGAKPLFSQSLDQAGEEGSQGHSVSNILRGGLIDEVAIFKAALSPERLAYITSQELLKPGLALNYNNDGGGYDMANALIGYWKFEQSVADRSNYNSHGTMVNEPQFFTNPDV
jgi:hypothetical protein|tara:strand:+ start:648 stop:1607 length:960 start_codon:yes stop_codon:yes gene_type:complete